LLKRDVNGNLIIGGVVKCSRSVGHSILIQGGAERVSLGRDGDADQVASG